MFFIAELSLFLTILFALATKYSVDIIHPCFTSPNIQPLASLLTSQVAGVYMSTRLFVNLSQAYIPLYLQVITSI